MTSIDKLDIHCAECSSKSSSLFCDLHENELDTLSEHKSCVKYKKGQTLFYEGAKAYGLHCVLDGKVKIFKVGSQGKQQIIRLSKKGDFLGYRALLGDEYYATSAEVLEEATICFIPKEDFFSVLLNNTTFYQKVVKSLAHELGVVEGKITDLSQKTVRERLAGYLLMLKETYGIEGDESQLIDLSISREDLANMVGTATETVIRLLSEFKKGGLIAFEGKKIKVLKTKELARTADFYR